MLNGVDVSSWNGRPDFSKIPGDFVIAKLTQGTKYTSPVAADQLKSAQAAGKLIGVYHYAGGGGWKVEADHFLAAAKPYIGKAILVLDWEKGQNPNFGNEGYARDFMAYVFAKTKVRPFLYISQGTCASFAGMAGIQTYPLWVAQVPSDTYECTGYNSTPKKGTVSPWVSEAIRQYCWVGHLKGFSGTLDLDAAYMTKAQWKKYAAGNTKTATTTTAKTTVPSYKAGSTYTVQASHLQVRIGAGTVYRAKKHSELTPDGQKHDTTRTGCLDKGTTVTCLKVQKVGSDIWLMCPSGWIAAYYKGNVYAK